ncbi:leucine-rich repeat receptor-like serine/threonine-protein kinase [Pyrus ussuriensis x Pyrus communis]|uniref:non-specific serine/threonine protein kinase n=1 Tax=Pyrus ussuriensis x Pyrus communis TaxID=2448454 RepID=A0A5N5H9H4_9ROSA|nr:leucine-rich repeat receptor-like serine/threonine-protein kinase [Pyrus ussuriensis x Pyrus communis]
MKMFFPRLLLHSLLVVCFAALAFGAARLPQDEVQALADIAKTLENSSWAYSVDPCSSQLPWTNKSAGFQRAVTCNCSFDDSTVCHVTGIIWQTQDLPGTLPREMVRLKYLQEIDLTRNYLSGTIPPEWSSLRLVNISLIGNRLTGPIPVEFANITTLKSLDLSSNSLSGALPEELGNFPHMERMLLSSNKFTGYLPDSFANLTTLKDFRINDCNFSGQIPDFIEKWTNLEKLAIQGSGLMGPIPSGISLLTSLTDLRITDLIGPELPFPPLHNMKNMRTLMLRSCNIIGELPPYLGQMPKLKTLDLSYNKLTGEIPSSFASLANADYISLTGNLLTGPVPTWPKNIVDLSFNNLTIGNTSCQSRGLNLFDSNSSGVSCSTAAKCPKTMYSSFHINCGGKEVTIENKRYEDDTFSTGPSSFYQSRTNWALSSTGYFPDDSRITDTFIWTNETRLSMADPQLVFGNVVIRNFTANVTNHTLKIHFNWAGKGTTGIPVRGVYGPLISAISVEPAGNISPGVNGVSVGAVVGIVAGGIFIILVILSILWRRGSLGQQKTLEDDLKGVDLQTGKFTFKQLKAATTNFDKANKIGEGGFGSVYKGILADGTMIAVKQLSSKSKQGNREFVNEIGMISALQHPHLVSLYGYCIEGNQLLLVYEYIENNSVAHALFGAGESHLKLDWPTRHKICIGIARGLAHLHEESRLKVVHRDIKATNVLLDKNLNPKISDFGLAKLDEEDNTHISTRIAGTFGYMAPEYAMRGYLTDKADVYSFGILVLEIVSGRNNTILESIKVLSCLQATLLKAQGNLLDLVDPRLGSNFNKKEMIVTINVALLCSSVTSAVRPTMSSVVSMLEGRVAVQEVVSDPNPSSNEIDAMRNHFQSYLEGSAGESQIQTESIEEPRTISYASGHDLYPINPDSNYRENINKRN